ncbi:mediator of RNA polymerase II transcription subunit 13-like isoform X2 [Ptychodera flava]|uniref:mediator of RNA polymerase II transcription subunit 13-like isoform X2 n=1 Tax=Ptychodera flava TaxID=63121 RepID=UPI003969CFB5
MTAANLVANGASLEDCHSNLFALTDLSGIKWRRYTATIPGPLVGPLEDPVLRSFANCLAGDILGVWRRVPDTNAEPLPPGASNKPENSRTRELWVYWYGDEPDFSNVIADELKVNETLEGTWENGLTYECRTLLFKALHNLLERCLLSRNFTRLGKWFIRPYGPDSEEDDQSEHVSFSFSFFLHGESTVCTSVEIQQHDPVRRLSVEHLSAAQGSATGFQVLLSPYGLSGVLTGQTFKESDQNTQKLLNEWRQFFPIDVPSENSENEDGADSVDAHNHQLPPAVEVLVGGVRMCYPSSFVLVAHPEEVHPPPPPPPQQGGMVQPAAAVQATQPQVTKPTSMPSVMSLTPPTSPCDQALPGETKITVMQTNSYQNQAAIDYSIMGIDSSQLLQMSPKIAQRVVDTVWHDSLTNAYINKPQSIEPTPAPPPPPPPPPPQGAGATSNSSEDVTGGGGQSASTTSTTTTTTTTTSSSTTSSSVNLATTGGFWDMTDPTVKANCTCSRQKAHQKRPFQFGKPVSGSSHMGSGLGSGSSKHKMDSKQEKQLTRNARPLTPFHHRSSLNDDLMSVDHDSANQRLGINQPQLITSAHQDSSAKKKIPPPNQQVKTAAGLETGPTDSPHSAVPSPLYPPPNTNSNTERTMPTLSPYPPPRPGSESEASNSMASTGFSRSDSQLANVTESLDPSQNDSSSFLARTIENILSDKDTEEENSKQSEDLLWQCYKLPQAEQVNFKRPLLPSHVYDEEQSLDGHLESLYTLSEENEFYQQPIKKLKPEYKIEPEEPALKTMIPMPMENRAPQPPSPEPVDPYEFMEDPTTQTGPLFQRNRGKDGKKGRGIPQRRSSIRKQDRKKQEEEQKKVDEEKAKQEQNQTKGDQANDKNPMVSIRSPMTSLPSARPDSSASLMRETDLVVTANDLDQLFESSDDDDGGLPFEDINQKISQITDDGPLRPNNSNNKGSSLNSSTNGFLGAGELTRMFPTPPSLEQNPAFSPCNPGSAEYINPDSAPGATHLDGSSAVPDLTDIEIEESLGSPKPEPIKDWSFVYKVPTTQRFYGSTMYAPLKALPSSKLPPLKVPENCVYKPSWQVGVAQKQEFLHSGKDTNLPSVSSVDTDMIKFSQPITSLPSAGTPGVLQSPATFQGSQEHQSNFENSPASTPSSYVKNLNSMEPPTPANNIPEAHSLFVNLVLSDSLLNIYKDRNFDSCVICVCNMNIKGNDAGLYLQDNTNQPQYKCQCGFSAIMNRRYGTGSGLFAEDEQDITGQQHDIALWAQNTDHVESDTNRKGTGSSDDANHSRTDGNRRVPDLLVEIIADQCSSPYGTLCRLDCVVTRHKTGNNSGLIARNQLELSDGCDACFHALEQGRQLVDGSSVNKLDDNLLKATCLQSWAFTTGAVDDRCQLSSQDCVRILTTLKPYLQEVIQRKRMSRSWEPAQYIVQGPLTWHTLFRIASKSKAESPEPLPVPSFLVGNDKDWLSLSPYAMHYWDKLLLEPYCATHDVAYVVVTPDNEFILQSTKIFFKELSAVYETCRLGRHVPYNPKVLRDGIMRIRKGSVKKVGELPVDDWFTQIGNAADAAKLRLYAQVCKHYLAPLLATQPVDSSMFTTSRPDRPSHMSSSCPAPPPSGSSSSSSSSGPQGSSSSQGHGDSNTDSTSSSTGHSTMSTSNVNTGQHSGSTSGHGDGHDGPSENRDGCKRAVVDNEDDNKFPPFLVVYLVDPFSYGKENEDGSQSVWTVGLLRCFAEMLPTLPENLRKTISVQVVPLQQVMQCARTEEGSRNLDQTKALAFSVFAQCRKYMVSTVSTKSLTGFGTAADLDKILKSKEAQDLPFKLYTPPYILAPMKDKQTELTETFGDAVQQCGELFVGYCLSHDQRWLLATCTDQRGEMMENCIINIDIPNSKRRKKVSVRRYAIQRLWDFILSVSMNAALPWRLIIGRLGRLGHGELKDWSHMLNRKSLLARSRHLRDVCKTCNFTGNTNDYPCILSACLVSMEPDPQVRIMADSVSTDRTGRSAFSQQNLTMLHSPGDATCTHIQVFPTSATTQVASSVFPSDPGDLIPGGGDGITDELMFIGSDELNEDLNDTDLSHFLDILPASPSPTDPDPSQLGGVEGRPGSPNNTGGGMQSGGDGTTKGTENEEVFILQQPLALGFYVSTASTWSSSQLVLGVQSTSRELLPCLPQICLTRPYSISTSVR